ncbi:hypothetical protein C8F01DRAFT_960568, partial [Mycena amicta]
RSGKRGPKSKSRDHFALPVAVTVNSEKRWEFRCLHCKSSVTFARTVSKKMAFSDEPQQPQLGNLATHMRKHGGLNTEIPGAPAPGELRGETAASAKLMEEFLLRGILNPGVNPTQAGFLKMFAAWLVECDLPWTTGETLGIRRLFARYVFSLYLRDASADILQAMERWVFERPELRPLLLSADEWKTLKALGKMLEAFTDVTLQMSHSSTPTLPWVLPMFEEMLDHLNTCRDNPDLPYTLRTAATAGLGKLKQYYDLAQKSQFNTIATRTSLEGERERKAKILFRHVFESYKTRYDAQQARSKPPEPAPSQGTSQSILDRICAFNDIEMP